MKRWFETRACLCFVLILVMGISPGSVLALENSDSNGAANAETVMDSREMLPGDVATDDGSVVDDSARDTLQVESLFTPRLTAPPSDNAYYFAKNIFYLSGYGMPNCTAYAWGRAYEILGTKPKLSTGNANQFWGYNLSTNNYSYGTTPKLGAIICWNGSACGHVAVVEAISGNKVTISESAWSGAFFRTYSYIMGSENSTSVGGFQGYIYINGTTSPLTAVVQKNIGSTYQTHIQVIGWQGWKQTGEISGTTGLSKRLEAIEIKLDNNGFDLGVSYQTHIENIGWQDWVANGNISGTTGKSLRLEAIKIKLIGKDADKFDIYYRVHAQNIGWMDWAKNGASSGTSGLCYRLEAIEIQVVPIGSDAPGPTVMTFMSNGL